MALGIWHDRINLVIGACISGALIGFEVRPIVIVGFSIGWLFSTLIFGPDSDITAKKRTQFLRYFLYPYSFIFRHRGISHHFLWGTITRNIYLLIILILFIYLVLYLGSFLGMQGSVMQSLTSIFQYSGIKIHPENANLHFVLSLFLGQWLSDLTHLALDRFSDKSGLFQK